MDLYSAVLQRFILPAIAHFTDVKIWHEYKKMMRVEGWSLDELKQYQFSKLKKIINHAYESVPFYRERFHEIGFIPDDMRNDEGYHSYPSHHQRRYYAKFPGRNYRPGNG